MRVASIGRAGENGVLFAGIVNDLHRAAGRSGVGAVMGSKNLKAVAVRGTRTDAYAPADPEAFFKAVDAGKAVLAANGVTGQGLPTYGTQVLMNVINELGAFPTRNARDSPVRGRPRHLRRGHARDRGPPTASPTSSPTPAASAAPSPAAGSPRWIPGHFSIKDKPLYQGASGGVEYEAAWALGAACGIVGPGGPHLRELPLQRGRPGPHHPGLHHRRGHGALRAGHPHQGRGRPGTALRLRRGPGEAGRTRPPRAKASARSSAWAPSACAPSTAAPSCP